MYTHSGHIYVLGIGADFYGIWDRRKPGAPAWRFPLTDEGWAAAWQQYSGLEPSAQPIAPASMATEQPAAAPPAPAPPGESLQPSPPLPLSTTQALAGMEIDRHVGLCMGGVVVKTELPRGFPEDGSEPAWGSYVQGAARQAIERMIANANELGGDAVVGVSLTSWGVGQAVGYVVAYGTAVVVRASESMGATS